MGVSEQFNGFLSNLKVTSTQQSDAETKVRGVTKCLNKKYYESDSEISHSFLVGSWGKKTHVRPPRDVDVFFVLPDSVYQRYALMSASLNKQSQLLQEVKGVLSGCYSSTKMRGDGQVVVVPFASYELEVVPAFQITDGYRICDTNEGGRWNTVHPDSEIRMMNYYDKESDGNTRDLVRMMKRWQKECSVPLKSFWIERLAQTFIDTWEHKGKSAVYYDYMVRDFLKNLVGRANSTIVAWGSNEVINLGDAWKSRAETAYARAKKAIEYECDKMPISSRDEWRKIFGPDFP